MLSEDDQLKLTDAIASGLLNWTDEARKLIQLLTPCWKAAYEDGATVAGDAYGFVEIQRPEFVSAAKVNGGKRVVGIEQTTRDNIARIISRGISEGKSQIELKKEIQNYVKQHTAPYKYPRIVEFKEELPKTISGKIIRSKL